MSFTTSRISDAFENAKQDFLSSLKDPSVSDSVSKITSSKDVYNFTAQLQCDQSRRQGLRNLNKINPYLKRLEQYANVIEVFVQAKPEILALIWGPIKLLLQMSDNLTQSFDAIVNTMAVIGSKLPLFEAYTMLFEANNRVADVLVLFYKDILNFYEIALNFFTAKRVFLLPDDEVELLIMAGWVIVFDSVWPRHKAKIQVVVGSIERHCLLMTEEVNLEHISDARKAQIADMDRWQQNFEFQERQNFQNIEAYISPKLYDDELDRLQRAICERTGRWLRREQDLENWSDPSDDSTRLVWLQGIPGAGKTHISSILANKLRSLSKTTLYAFLSYRQGNVSTISIIHSLIFQLAIGMEHFDELLKQDLRAKLFDSFQSSQRNLKSNTRFTRQTLTNLLNCVGPAYIIIDGLDEIPEIERVETLNELLEVMKTSVETKVLISSRAEDDIATVLKTYMPKIIRVDDKNRGCIQAYVSVTSERWLSQSDFDEETCTEIKGLLTPLSAKAKGMFLYARVVMDNIQTYHTPDLIQSELKALPESLEEAYARVFQRLHDLQPSSKAMSRRALGWIGCSPAPLKIQELGFALSLDPDGEGQLPQSQSSLNIVRLCGPIVETSDDYVYFVHFTVREQSDAFSRALEANLEMARTCLNYLSRDIFDIELEPDKIVQSITSGSYRLYWFAATQWTEIVRRCARLLCSQPAPEALISALNRFSYRCENSSYEIATDLDLVHNNEFEVFQKAAPAIHKLLQQDVHFQHMDVGNWKLEEGEDNSWANLDPLTLSYTSLDIYQHFESLICSGKNHKVNCNCPKLMKFYGDRLFRCKYAICQYQQIAFKTRHNRDAHCRSHDRPCKCPHPSCDFSTLGFYSRDQLGRHLQNCHSSAPPKPIHLIQNPDEDELVPLLSDMIAMGMAAEVTALCPRFERLKSSQQESLLEEAAFCGSLQVWQCLMRTRNSCLTDELLYTSINASIKGENIEILERAALQIKDTQKTKRTYRIEFMHLGANSESVEVFEIWKRHLSRRKMGEMPMITTEYVIQEIKDPVKQERLAIVLSEHAELGYLTKHDLGRALKAVASTTCSISLARALLDSGADVNFRNEKSSRSDKNKSPLLLAATKKSRAAAEMMRFLLLVGADPNASNRVVRGNVDELRTVAMGSGAKQIFRWIGMTWDELVEWVAEQQSNNSQGEVVSRLYS